MSGLFDRSDVAAPAHELGIVQMAALSAPSLPLIALGFVLNSYLPEYYASKFGYDLGLIGFILTVVRLVDIAADPVIGGVMDRNSGRRYRFKIWHAIGVPLVLLGAAMIFVPQTKMPMAWVTVGLLLLYLGQSLGILSQYAIAALVSATHAGRLRVYTWVQTGNMVGVIIMLIVPPLIVARLGMQQRDMAYGMGVTLMLMAPIAMGALLLVVPEPSGRTERNVATILEYFRLFRFASVRRLVLADLFMGLSFGMGAALMVLFFTRVHGWSHVETSYLMLTQFTAGMLLLPLWQRLAARIGKRRTLALIGCGIVVVQSSMLLIGYFGHPFTYALFAAYGTLYAGSQMLPRAMMADVADEMLLETGSDLKGLLFAYLAGTYKCGLAVSVGLGLGLLSLIGFNPALPTNSPATIRGLMLLTAAGPALLALVFTWFAWRFPLTRSRHEKVLERLRARGNTGGLVDETAA